MLRDAVNQMNDLNAEVLDLSQKLATTEAARDKLQSRIEELTKDNDKLDDELGDLRKQADEGKKAIETAEKLRATLEDVRVGLMTYAQTAGVTATLTGVTQDPAGKPLATATVTLIDKDSLPGTNAERVVSTKDTGEFTFENLVVGHRYQIKASWIQKTVKDVGDSVTTYTVGRSGETDEIVLIHDNKQIVLLKGYQTSTISQPKKPSSQ